MPLERMFITNHAHTKKCLGAVARPRYKATRDMSFDNKIGIWSFVKQVPVTRRLVNKESGVLVETKIGEHDYKRSLCRFYIKQGDFSDTCEVA